MTATSRIIRLAISAILSALAANCFLKYLWWTACYSAWSGIPKLHDQWKAAGVKASFNGWSFLALEAAAIVILFLVISLRSAKFSAFLNVAMRLAASFFITVAGTTVFALILSWLKQDVH